MEQAAALARYLSDGGVVFSLKISAQQSKNFLEYLQALSKWNRYTNLTAIEDPHEIIIKHFVDSMAPLRFGLLKATAAILDVGTGAGFPGIPLKIMQEDLRLTLLEPNQKKVSFLLYLLGLLHLQDVKAINRAVAELGTGHARPFDVVVIRGLKLSITDWELFPSLVKPDGMVLVYRATPMDRSQAPKGFVIFNEWTYELPFGYGSRVLTGLCQPAEQVFHVEQKT